MTDRPPEPEPEGHATPDPTVPIDSLATSGGTLGPFLLRELIGSGGMGEVWKAEQTSPVRRTVALKLIKAGMDSREVLARFEAERQALALMDHPCIAKVFDAGTTPQRRPWFAMEYVQGVPISWPIAVYIVFSVSFCVVAFATPKSMILGRGFPSTSATRMLPGFRSLWSTAFWCACCTPSQTCWKSCRRSSMLSRRRSQ